MSIPVLLISMLLFFVLFFGIGFLLNMILRATWVMVVVYPLICVFIIDKISTWEYFSQPAAAFTALKTHFFALGKADVIILTTGLLGAVMSGVIIKTLRQRGYQMF
ncbi:YuiB family protein [Ectobacillus ponti]|uniref:YuiB family protein n=1 Tax=Ectobacillus ponti TaxID=2961894 RepID=A0AA41XAL1_9BACI|nr:YuiB family protein [Ectobacillus ponti]MCP8969799.1 YuiB family protein [Ectobacillus ponti]